MSQSNVYSIGLPGVGKTIITKCFELLSTDFVFVDKNYNNFKTRSLLLPESKIIMFKNSNNEKFQELIDTCSKRIKRSIDYMNEIASSFQPLTDEEMKKYNVLCIDPMESLYDNIFRIWEWLYEDKEFPQETEKIINNVLENTKYQNLVSYGYFAALVEKNEMHKLIDIQNRIGACEKFADNKSLDDEFHCTLYFIRKNDKQKDIRIKQFMPVVNQSVILTVTGVGYNDKICAAIVDPICLSDNDVPFHGEKPHISLSRESVDVSWADSTKMLLDENSTIVLFNEPILIESTVKQIK